MLLHLPAMPGHSAGARVKNGPVLAGHGAKAVRDAIAAKITTLPETLRRSLIWDQGAELSQHAQLRIDTALAIYFCDPRSPWRRGTNENTNGLLRQYFPKGTDIGRYAEHELDAGATTLNSTADLIKHLTGRPWLRRSISYYAWHNKPVLRRLLEPKQYASRKYRRLLKAHAMVCSMSRRANCWNNAPAALELGYQTPAQYEKAA